MLVSLGLLSLAAAQTTMPAPPATLQLTAPVGTSVELRTVSTSRMTVSDIQVTANPGGKATPAQVEEARKAMQEGLNVMNRAATTVNGKAFFKVTSRDAAGNTTLLNSIVQSLPATPGKKAETMTIRVTQVIAPDGKVSGLKLESDQPQVNAMFQTLTPEKLQQLTRDFSSDAAGPYTVPLQPGQPHTTTVSLDMQDLMSTLVGSLAGPRATALFGDFKSTPLTVTTTTTSQGRTSAGQHTFHTSSEYADWKFSLTSQDARLPLTMSAELLNVQASGTSTYTPAGLPSHLNQKTNMTMKMVMDMDDVQVTLTMNLQQDMTMQPR